jgi:F0F1-type ATP synthase epsilon subunit
MSERDLGPSSNMLAAPMNLKVLLPFQIFAEKTGVSRIVAETHKGSIGLLPHRLDCVAALAPGILTYETESEGEVFLAVDVGVRQDRSGRFCISPSGTERSRSRPVTRGGGARVSDFG